MSLHVNESSPLAPIKLARPTSRIELMKSRCVGMNILDIGCLDETAFESKIRSGFWLHEEIASVAKSVIGIDNSDVLKQAPIETGFSTIVFEDIFTLEPANYPNIDVIVMGELIEHLVNPLSVLSQLVGKFPKSSIVLSTPNATGITNVIGALVNRESNHPDHVAIYSYKTLCTLMSRLENVDFQIQPYLTLYSEAVLRNKGLKRKAVLLINAIINRIEWLRPFYSGGFVVTIAPKNI